MSQPIIQYNKHLDFLSSLYIYANIESIQQEISNLELNFNIAENFWNWKNILEQELSLFFLNDIKQLFHKHSCLNVTLEETVINGSHQTLEDIYALDGVNLQKKYLEQLNVNQEITDANLEDIYKKIAGELNTDEYNRVSVNFEGFKELVKNPDQVKTQLDLLLKTAFKIFDSIYFPGITDEVNQILKRNQLLLEENKINFLKNVGLADYSKYLEKEDIRIFMLHCIDFQTINRTSKRYIIFGSRIEKLMREMEHSDAAIRLFKALSDTKRFETLKLINQSKSYANEMAKKLDITPATMSYHIDRLVSLGILNADIEGRKKIHYTVNKEKLRNIFTNAYEILTGEVYRNE